MRVWERAQVSPKPANEHAPRSGRLRRSKTGRKQILLWMAALTIEWDEQTNTYG